MQPTDRNITHLTLNPLPRRLGMLLDVLDRVTNNLTIETKVVTPQPARTDAVIALSTGRS